MPTPPTRVFLDWTRPLLPQAAAHLVAQYAQGPVADLRGVVLVLPGGRARRRMVELLLDEASARGLTLIPPASTTVGGLPDLLHDPPRPVADPAAARRAWSRALRSVSQDALRLVFPRLPEKEALAEWDQMAELLSALHESVAAEGHSFSDVARICQSGMAYDDGPRWSVMARVQDRYLRVLDEVGLADRFRTRAEALEAGDVRHEGEIWLVSLAELPGLTRRLLEASGALVHTLVHAPADFAEPGPTAASAAPFDDLGIPTTDYWERAPVPVREEVLTVVERPVDQADATLELLAGLGGRYAAEEVVIAVHPDSDVLPFLEQRLEARGATPRYAAGTPFPRTGPYRLLEAVAAYVEDRSYPALASLLRHPDAGPLLDPAPGAPSRLDAIEVGDRFFNAHLPDRLQGDLPRGERESARFPAVVRTLERSGPLSSLTGRRTFSEWMPLVRDVLLAAYGGRALDRSRSSDRHLLDALARIRASAARLATLPERLDEACQAGAAIRSLLLELRGEALPPEARRDALELVDWLEIPLDDAPVVAVTGFNEGLLPESVNGHAFLPDALRSRLGLMDNRRRVARDAYRLTTVLHSKEVVRLVAGRRSSQGDPLRPSRLMFRIPEEEVGPRVLAFFAPGGEEAEPGTSPRGVPRPSLASLGLRPAARSRFTVPPEPVLELGLSRVPTRLPVTAFKALMADPYRFVLERVYGLEGVHDEAREMDPLVFGTLAHGVLQRFGTRAIEAPDTFDITDEASVRAALLSFLAQEVEARFGGTALPAVTLQVAQLEARLSAFARRQAAWARLGWRIVAVERQPEGEGVPFEVDGEPVLLRGRIDRIDHDPETGRWAVLDYKSGSKVETPEKAHLKGRGGARRWVDLQLPLYRRLLEGIVDSGGERVVPGAAVRAGRLRLGYIALPKDPRETDFLLAEWTAEDLAWAEECAREAVARLREGRFEFDSRVTKPSWFGTDPLELLLARGWQAAVSDNADGGENGDEGGTP